MLAAAELAVTPDVGAMLGAGNGALPEDAAAKASVAPRGIDANGGGAGNDSIGVIEAMGGSIPCCS